MPIEWKKCQMSKAPIVLAVDTPELKTAVEWVKATHGLISVYKLGLEFFLSFGSSGVRAIQEETDSDIFLDLKLHDIPHTVSGATKVIANLAPKYLTVHASGGAAMIRAAADAIPDSFITGVTILTSLGDSDVKSIGYEEPALESAVRLAKLAVASGARAIVCSPLEITAIRKAIGSEIIIITPGVRPAGATKVDDQVRTMTPGDAITAGASLVVIGRPITQNWMNGSSAMREAAAEISAQLLISE
jgi:orotidine-5'-phosphate decarboxylase